MDVSVDINAFENEVLTIQKGLAEAIPKILQGKALTTFAKIRNRIQNKGIDSNGKPFPAYSTNELPTYFFEGKATNGGGRNAIKKAEKEHRGLSYEEFKSANNGPNSVAFRNLTLTGDMWRNTGITATEQKPTGLEVVIEGETDFAKNKADWNSDKIGDFMQVSKQEEEESTLDFQNEIDKFLAQQK